MRILYFTAKRCATNRWLDVNLDSRWRFRCVPSIPRICVTDGRALPYDFWKIGDRQSVENVSALVGANGAGKTSLAHSLAQTFGNGKTGRPYVLIAEYGGLLHLYSNVHSSKRKSLVSDLRKKFGELLHLHWDESIGELGAAGVNARPEMERFFVYISPHMAADEVFRFTEKHGKSVYDYSTTGLMRGIAGKCIRSDLNPVKLYAAEEKCRILKAVYAYAQEIRENNHDELVQTKILAASNLIIAVDTDSVKTAREAIVDRGDRERSGFVALVDDLLGHPLAKGPAADWGVRAFVNFVVTRAKDTNGEIEFDSDVKGPRVMDLCRSIAENRSLDAKEAVDKILKWARWWEVGETDSPEVAAKKRLHGEKAFAIARIVSILSGLKQYARAGKIKIPLSHFKAGQFSEILQVVVEYAKTVIETEYLHFSITPKLSAGEMSFLSIWGRLFDFTSMFDDLATRITSGRGNTVNSFKHEFDLVVFFDEAEITLHPEWQRMLVWNTLWFFEHLAPSAHVHVIFASHSPILLSDIPKGNVCFLPEKKMSKSARMRHDNELARLHETFAANIYDLYRLPFFMKDGMTGRFSREKVKDLMSGKLGIDQITLIGDEMVRTYLEQRRGILL